MTAKTPSGWLLLDKESGPSSARVVARVKRLFSVQRVGHTGTLDPLAEGLLVIAVGATTRWCGYLLDAQKSYRFTLCLGVRTATQDSEGEVEQASPNPVPELSAAEIEAVLARFRGSIQQIPPMYSAVQIDGTRLYRLARRGEVVARQPRTVEVRRLELYTARGDEWELEVDASKGLYVRTLGADLGEALGCGAYVRSLRRLRVGPFDVAQAMRLDDLEALSEAARMARLLPDEDGLPDWPQYHCTMQEGCALKEGRVVVDSGRSGPVRLYTEQGDFLGLGEADAEGLLRPKRLLPLD